MVLPGDEGAIAVKESSTAASTTTGDEFDSYAEHAGLLSQWAEAGYESEKDLYVARAALQYLCLEDLKGANRVLAVFITLPGFTGLNASPLIHFIQFCKLKLPALCFTMFIIALCLY